MSMRLFEMKRERQTALDKAEAIIQKAEKENRRQLTESEQQEVTANLDKVKTLNPEIQNIMERNQIFSADGTPIPLGSLMAAITGSGSFPVNGNAGFKFTELAKYLRDPQGVGMRASLTEGSDLGHVLPPYEVSRFLAAYSSLDPFRAAGATVAELNDGQWTHGKVPFVLTGAAPSTYAEGSGPSSAQDASVVVADLNTPAKIAFLTKISEEGWADIDGLASALGTEGIRREYNKHTALVTSALTTALSSAGSTVSTSGDALEDLLNCIAAIPPVFANPSNAWMLNRHTLATIRNTRIGSGGFALAFDPTSGRCLSYPVVLNDSLPNGRLVFGNWAAGCFVRRTAIFTQLLNEVYREAGQVGMRFTMRADQAFFAEVANQSTAEGPLVMLTAEDIGS